MQHPGLIQQWPTLRTMGLAFLVCLLGLSVFTAPAQAFQDEAGADEAAVPVDEGTDDAAPADDGGTTNSESD